MLNIEESMLSAVSIGTSITSDAKNVKDVSSFGIQAVLSGTPGGLVKLQISNDEGSPNGTTVSNWDDLDYSPVYISEAGSHFWNVTQAMYNWVRISYTRVSGTGTISARFVKKRESN